MTRSVFLSIIALFVLALFSTNAAAATSAADFTLPAHNGKNITLSNYRGSYVVLEWFNPGCPFVKKHYSGGNMQDLQKTYTEKGVVWLAINSSAVGKQGHLNVDSAKAFVDSSKAAMTAICFDHQGLVGKLYGARTTPEMVIIDPKGVIIYHGAIDSVKSADPADIPDSINYVREALDAHMAGKPVPTAVTKPYGCSVKYP